MASPQKPVKMAKLASLPVAHNPTPRPAPKSYTYRVSRTQTTKR